jgi:hypothetical protein
MSRSVQQQQAQEHIGWKGKSCSMKYTFTPSQNALLTTLYHSLARKGTVPWGNEPDYVSCLAPETREVPSANQTPGDL